MAKKSERDYTFERLDQDSRKAKKLKFEMYRDRFIILSDVHKGDPHSDRGVSLSRIVVRIGWKFLQNIFKFTNNRAARNNKIRNNRDKYLYEWAKARKLLMIAGHTHRGMFESYSKTYQLLQKARMIHKKLMKTDDLAERLLLEKAKKEIIRMIVDSKEEREKGKTTSRLEEKPLPCYFNDGCCVHKDGITGIEIDRGTIRLVKWELSDTRCGNEEGRVRVAHLIGPERKIYQSGDIGRILSKI